MSLVLYVFLMGWGVICFYGCLSLCLLNERNYCCKCYRRYRVNNVSLIKHDFIDYPDTLCPICLDDFTKSNPPYIIQFCNSDRHPFHRRCILQSFRSHNMHCPVCRSTFPIREV